MEHTQITLEDDQKQILQKNRQTGKYIFLRAHPQIAR